MVNIKKGLSLIQWLKKKKYVNDIMVSQKIKKTKKNNNNIYE